MTTQPAVKRPHSLRNIAIIVGVVAVALVIGSALVASYLAQRIYEDFGTFTTTTPTATPTGAPSGESWRQVATFTGSDIRNTEPFTIRAGVFRIHWEATRLATAPCQDQPISLVTYLYRGEDLLEVVSSGTAQTSGTSYAYQGPGTYYLNLTPLCVSYSIIVEEQA